mgnify:CR=1 FL=1|tara:strand:+ start:737 stop:1651 length:915 start_codon:yes stop_codon:yes gene_type:complete
MKAIADQKSKKTMKQISSSDGPVTKPTRQKRIRRATEAGFEMVAFEIVRESAPKGGRRLSVKESEQTVVAVVSKGNYSVGNVGVRKVRAKPSVKGKYSMALAERSNVAEASVLIRKIEGSSLRGFSEPGTMLGFKMPEGLSEAQIDELFSRFSEAARQVVESPKSSKKTKGGAKSPAEIKQMVISAGGLLTSADITAKRGQGTSNPSATTQRWKKSGKVFALSYEGKDLYPEYLFDEKDDYKPRPVIKAIKDALAEKMGPWQIAFWFICSSNFLGGKSPRDVISKDPGLVLKAAKHETEGYLHG